MAPGRKYSGSGRGTVTVALTVLVFGAFGRSAAFAATPCGTGSPTICYVDADSLALTPNGTTWALAYRDLQDAIGNSGCDEIWVAEGTYKPHASDETVSFDICGRSGIELYGGFDGTESSCADRDFACNGGTNSGKPCAVDADCPGSTCGANPTILSGDIGADDESDCTACAGYCVGGICLEGDNSYHVVSCHDGDQGAKIDGFIIEAGTADGPGPETGLDNQGAALDFRGRGKRCFDNEASAGDEWGAVCTSSSTCNSGEDECKFFLCFSGGVDVHNCLIRYNFASNHGAVNDHFSDSDYQNCYFHDNDSDRGGAILVDNGAPTINNCLFEDNIATGGSFREGGAVWFQGRDVVIGQTLLCPADPAPVVSNCVFTSNESGGKGGALFSISAHPVISDSDFTSNSTSGGTGALGGGAIWAESGRPLIKDCTFTENDAIGTNHFGGALYFEDAAAHVENCVLDANSATNVGKAVYNNNRDDGSSGNDCFGAPVYKNCTFKNHSTGICTYEQDATLYVGCRFSDNGGGLRIVSSGPVTVFNSILDGNSTAILGTGFGDFDVINSTIVDNGTGLFIGSSSTVNLYNSIVWGNTDNFSYGTSITVNDASNVIENLSAESPPLDLSGNTAANPQFFDASTGDYRLRTDSSAISQADVNEYEVPCFSDGDCEFMLGTGSVCTGESEGCSVTNAQGVCDEVPFDLLGNISELGDRVCNTLDAGAIEYSHWGNVDGNTVVDGNDITAVQAAFAGNDFFCKDHNIDNCDVVDTAGGCTPDGSITIHDVIAVAGASVGIVDCCTAP